MMRMVSVETASLSDKSPKQPHCQIKVQNSLIVRQPSCQVRVQAQTLHCIRLT